VAVPFDSLMTRFVERTRSNSVWEAYQRCRRRRSRIDSRSESVVGVVQEAQFHFRLRPVDEILPWGNERPSLSWFGLSDGWYWLEIDGQELFRVSDTRPKIPPYVDYQVVRLWEDILEIAPDVLGEVPSDIAAQLCDPDGWLAAVERIQADDTLDEELVENGLGWWRARYLDSSHLVAAPRLWLWRTGELLSTCCGGPQRNRPPRNCGDLLGDPPASLSRASSPR
jgi:hypothetical protein